MAKKKKIVIEKDPENVIDVKIMEQAIEDVANAAKKLNGSRLGRRAVTLLIQDCIGQGRITRSQISDVLDAADQLGKIYLK